MTTPQNPYGPQAQPAQPYFPSQQNGRQAGYPRHSAPAPQASWNPGPQQPYQAPMTTGYPQQGGYAPQHPAHGYAPHGPAQGYGAYAGPASAAQRQDVGAPAGLPQQPAAAVPAQRSGEQPLPQYPTGGGRPPKPPRNGLGTTALVLGILGALFSFIPFIGVIAWPLVILGLIFGIVGFFRARAGKANNGGVAIAGTVLSLLGLIICIVYASAFTSAVANLPTTPTPAVSAPAAGQNDAATTGKPGDTLTAGGLQVTAEGLQSKNQEFVGPMKCAKVTYRNTGSVQVPYNTFDWKLQNPAGAITDPTFGGDNTLSAGELAPGGTTSGQVCFDAKSGQAGAYTLTYNGGLLGGDKLSWTN